MGCGSSKNETARRRRRREADEYAKRKKNGFKDPGLETVRRQAVRKKKHLKHVKYDPTSPEYRHQKIKDIKSRQQQQQQQQQQEQKEKEKAGGGWRKNNNNKKNEQHATNAPSVVIMTEGTIAAQRKKLKHVK